MNEITRVWAYLSSVVVTSVQVLHLFRDISLNEVYSLSLAEYNISPFITRTLIPENFAFTFYAIRWDGRKFVPCSDIVSSSPYISCLSFSLGLINPLIFRADSYRLYFLHSTIFFFSLFLNRSCVRGFSLLRLPTQMLRARHPKSRFSITDKIVDKLERSLSDAISHVFSLRASPTSLFLLLLLLSTPLSLSPPPTLEFIFPRCRRFCRAPPTPRQNVAKSISGNAREFCKVDRFQRKLQTTDSLFEFGTRICLLRSGN